MKLRDLLAHLKEIEEKYPESLDMDIVYSSDDEGNNYSFVNFKPSLGEYVEGEFNPLEQVKENPEDWGYDSFDDFNTNAICIN